MKTQIALGRAARSIRATRFPSRFPLPRRSLCSPPEGNILLDDRLACGREEQVQGSGYDKPQAGSSPERAFVKQKEGVKTCCHNGP